MRVEIIAGLGRGLEEKPFTNGFIRLSVAAIAAKEFGGYTLTRAESGWRAPSGIVVREPAMILLIDGVTDDALPAVYAFAAVVRDTLRQSAVIVNTYNVESRYV